MNCPYCGNPSSPGTVYGDAQDFDYTAQEFWCGGLASAPKGCGRHFRVQLEGICLDPDFSPDDICMNPEHNHLERLFQVIFRKMGGTKNWNIYVTVTSLAAAKVTAAAVLKADSQVHPAETGMPSDWEIVEVNELE